MKHKMTSLLAVFAVAIMMSCALVPAMAENTNNEVTDDNIDLTSDLGLERKGDIIPKMISTILSGISKQFGLTLVSGVEKTPITDFPHEIGADQGTIDGTHSATLSGDYTINEGGVITVENGGMLIIFPLDDGENTGFSITQPGNGGKKTPSPSIVMKYGSYLNIFGLTFQFLFPLKSDTDSITLLTVGENTTKTIGPGGVPTVRFEYNHVGEFKLIPQLLNTHAGSMTAAYVLEKNMTIDKKTTEPNPYTGEYYTMWNLEGGTIEKIDDGIIIKNTKFYINYTENIEKSKTTYTGCGVIKELVIGGKSKTTEPEQGETVITTDGKFSLNVYSFFSRFTFAYNDQCDFTINFRNDMRPDLTLNTGLIDYKKTTTSKVTNDGRTLKVNKQLPSEGLIDSIIWRCEFIETSLSYIYGDDERPEGCNFYKDRMSIGSTLYKPWSVELEFRFEKIKFDMEYSMDTYRGTLNVTKMNIEAANISILANYEYGFSSQLEIAYDSRWDTGVLNESWFGKLSTNNKLVLSITNFSTVGNMDEMMIKFNMNFDMKTELDGKEYKLTAVMNDFNGVFKADGKKISITSIDLTNNIPLSEMMICGYEKMETDSATGEQSSISELNNHNDCFANIHGETIEISNSVIKAAILNIELRDFEASDVLYGDSSITFNNLVVSEVDDKTIIDCNDANGYIKNPGSDEQRIILSNNPKIKMIAMDEYELISGSAKFGNSYLPISIKIDNGSMLETNGTRFQKASFETNAVLNGKISLGYEINVFDGSQKNRVITNLYPLAYDVSFDLSDLTKGTVVAHDGYYLPAQYSGTGYSLTSSDSRNGALIISGSEANLNIECNRDSYTFKFEGYKETTTHKAGEVILLPENGPTRKGYEFAGWTDGSGDVFYDLYIMPTRDVTLRPVYAAVDVTPVFKQVDGETIMYIDGGDAEIVKIPVDSNADKVVIKTKDIIMEAPFQTVKNYYSWANNKTVYYSSEDPQKEDIYLKAIKMDSVGDQCLYDIKIINSDGDTNDYYIGPCDFEITVTLKTSKTIESVEVNCDDGNGLSHSIEVSDMKMVRGGTYEVTFDANELSTFTLDVKYGSDVATTTSNAVVWIVMAVVIVLCLIAAIAFFRMENKH